MTSQSWPVQVPSPPGTGTERPGAPARVPGLSSDPLDRLQAELAETKAALATAMALGAWCAAERDRLRSILGEILDALLGADLDRDR